MIDWKRTFMNERAFLRFTFLKSNSSIKLKQLGMFLRVTQVLDHMTPTLHTHTRLMANTDSF